LSGRISAAPEIKNEYFIITSVDDREAQIIELNSGKSVNKVILEEYDYFTGEPSQANNLFIYPTSKGILGFALGAEGCPAEEKKP
jgi:hypothetical protein